MTYHEAKAALDTLQQPLLDAQSAADAANATLSAAQAAVTAAQSAVVAFHRYTTMTETANNSYYTNVQFPEDSEISGAQVTVYRTTPPDPIACDISTFDSVNGWSDPTPFSLSWTDNGPAQ